MGKSCEYFMKLQKIKFHLRISLGVAEKYYFSARSENPQHIRFQKQQNVLLFIRFPSFRMKRALLARYHPYSSHARRIFIENFFILHTREKMLNEEISAININIRKSEKFALDREERSQTCINGNRIHGEAWELVVNWSEKAELLYEFACTCFMNNSSAIHTPGPQWKFMSKLYLKSFLVFKIFMSPNTRGAHSDGKSIRIVNSTRSGNENNTKASRNSRLVLFLTTSKQTSTTQGYRLLLVHYRSFFIFQGALYFIYRSLHPWNIKSFHKYFVCSITIHDRWLFPGTLKLNKQSSIMIHKSRF